MPKLVNGDPFVLLVNGDVIEGIHHGTRQVISSDVTDHVTAAVDALRPLAEAAATTHLTLGTECHTQSTEAAIGKALKASKCAETGKHAHSRIVFSIKGCVLSATHHCSATSRPWLESGEYCRALHGDRRGPSPRTPRHESGSAPGGPPCDSAVQEAALAAKASSTPMTQDARACRSAHW